MAFLILITSSGKQVINFTSRWPTFDVTQWVSFDHGWTIIKVIKGGQYTKGSHVISAMKLTIAVACLGMSLRNTEREMVCFCGGKKFKMNCQGKAEDALSRSLGQTDCRIWLELPSEGITVRPWSLGRTIIEGKSIATAILMTGKRPNCCWILLEFSPQAGINMSPGMTSMRNLSSLRPAN